MTKEETVSLMLQSINADNFLICTRSGLSEEDATKQIEASQPSLSFMMSNIYDKLKIGGVLA